MQAVAELITSIHGLASIAKSKSLPLLNLCYFVPHIKAAVKSIFSVAKEEEIEIGWMSRVRKATVTTVQPG